MTQFFNIDIAAKKVKEAGAAEDKRYDRIYMHETVKFTPYSQEKFE